MGEAGSRLRADRSEDREVKKLQREIARLAREEEAAKATLDAVRRAYPVLGELTRILEQADRELTLSLPRHNADLLVQRAEAVARERWEAARDARAAAERRLHALVLN